MQRYLTKTGILAGTALLALVLVNTPARAGHDHDVLLPLAAGFAAGVLISHGHSSRHYYHYHRYRHYRHGHHARKHHRGGHYRGHYRHSRSHGYQSHRYHRSHGHGGHRGHKRRH